MTIKSSKQILAFILILLSLIIISNTNATANGQTNHFVICRRASVLDKQLDSSGFYNVDKAEYYASSPLKKGEILTWYVLFLAGQESVFVTDREHVKYAASKQHFRPLARKAMQLFDERETTGFQYITNYLRSCETCANYADEVTKMLEEAEKEKVHR